MYKWLPLRKGVECYVDDDNKILGKVGLNVFQIEAVASLTNKGILGVYYGLAAAKKAVEKAIEDTLPNP